MPRPFAVIGFTVFFVSAFLYDSDIRVTVTVFILFAVALVVSFSIKNLREQRVFPCAFVSGLIACILLINTTYFSYLPAVSYDGKTYNVVAQITSEPTLNYGNYYYYADAIEINGEKSDLKLRLSFSSSLDIDAYDIVEGDFTFYKLGSSSEEALSANKANGIYMGAYPSKGEYIETVVPEAEKPFAKRIVNLRIAIKDAIYSMMPGESGALAVALIIGEKSGMTDEILRDFQAVGITHVICVSGFHLSLWAMLIMKFLKGLHINERVSAVIAAFGVIVFMLIAGLTYSVIRSGVMMLLYLLAKVLMKNRDSLNSLGFSLVFLALYNPFSMGSVGLQLSALATLGLILYSEQILPQINEKFSGNNHKLLNTAAKKLITTLAVPVTAAAFTMPVSISLYGGFNFTTIFANIVAVPVSTACMLMSAGGAVMTSFLPDNLNVIGHIGARFGDILIRFAAEAANFRLFDFKIDTDKQYVIICAVLAVCITAVFMAYAGKNVKGTACVLCAVIFTGSILFAYVSQGEETRLNVIDTGNGTSILVSVDNKNILIGCGGTDELGENNIIDAIDAAGGKLNTVILPDSDRYSAAYLTEILTKYRPEGIYCGNLPVGTKPLLNQTEISDSAGMNFTEDIIIKSADADGCFCVYVENEDLSALICFDSVFDYSLLPEDFKHADIIISRNDYPLNIENNNCKLIIFNAENLRAIVLRDELTDSGIKSTATGGCGNIIIRGKNGCISANRK